MTIILKDLMYSEAQEKERKQQKAEGRLKKEDSNRTERRDQDYKCTGTQIELQCAIPRTREQRSHSKVTSLVQKQVSRMKPAAPKQSIRN